MLRPLVTRGKNPLEKIRFFFLFHIFCETVPYWSFEGRQLSEIRSSLRSGFRPRRREENCRLLSDIPGFVRKGVPRESLLTKHAGNYMSRQQYIHTWKYDCIRHSTESTHSVWCSNDRRMQSAPLCNSMARIASIHQVCEVSAALMMDALILK